MADTNTAITVSQKPVTDSMDGLKKGNFFLQTGTALAGGAAGAVVLGRLTNSKIGTAIGALAGSVIMNKIGPEFAKDVAGAKDFAKSKGKKFDLGAFGKNLINIKGQSYTGNTGLDM